MGPLARLRAFVNSHLGYVVAIVIIAVQSVMIFHDNYVCIEKMEIPARQAPKLRPSGGFVLSDPHDSFQSQPSPDQIDYSLIGKSGANNDNR